MLSFFSLRIFDFGSIPKLLYLLDNYSYVNYSKQNKITNSEWLNYIGPMSSRNSTYKSLSNLNSGILSIKILLYIYIWFPTINSKKGIEKIVQLNQMYRYINK